MKSDLKVLRTVATIYKGFHFIKKVKSISSQICLEFDFAYRNFTYSYKGVEASW